MTAGALLRYIPAGSREVPHPDNLGVAFVRDTPYGPTQKLRFEVIAYTGRARRHTFFETHTSAESRDRRVKGFFDGLSARATAMRQAREGRTRPHTLKAGDILHHSWGYEQTNCDYYQVLSATAHSAISREIVAATVEGSTYSHGMADMRVPVKDAFCGEPVTVRINGYNQVAASKGSFSYGCVSRWDGKAHNCSWYA